MLDLHCKDCSLHAYVVMLACYTVLHGMIVSMVIHNHTTSTEQQCYSWSAIMLMLTICMCQSYFLPLWCLILHHSAITIETIHFHFNVQWCTFFLPKFDWYLWCCQTAPLARHVFDMQSWTQRFRMAYYNHQPACTYLDQGLVCLTNGTIYGPCWITIKAYDMR